MDTPVPPSSQPPSTPPPVDEKPNASQPLSQSQPPTVPPVSNPQQVAPITQGTPIGTNHSDQPKSAKRRFFSPLIIALVVLFIIFIGGVLYLRQALYKTINNHASMGMGGMTQSMDMSKPMNMGASPAMGHMMKKEIVIGSDATFPPMESINDQNEIVGFDADLGKAIGKEMGIPVEVKNIPWDTIFTSLEEKNIDMIMSSVSITEERKKKYAFSDPYLNAGQVILIRKENTKVTSPVDLKGLKVGAQEATTSLEQAQKYASSTAVSYPDPKKAVADLVSGKIDAVVADLPAAKGYKDANATLKICCDPFTSEYYGIVFRKDDEDLKNHVNQILKELEQKGVIADLKAKWLD